MFAIQVSLIAYAVYTNVLETLCNWLAVATSLHVGNCPIKLNKGESRRCKRAYVLCTKHREGNLVGLN